MNEITTTISRMFKPALAIMVYEDDQNGKGYYLESHQVSETGQILEGKPLLQETIQGIVDVFFDERKDRAQVSGNVPEFLLQYKPLPGGHYKLVWYKSAEIRMMHFASQLKLTSCQLWVPPMIYEVERSNLMVYATKAIGRPKDNARLYRAPFHNVADDGKVCLGNARVKKPAEKTFNNIIKYWEDLFWLSEFSHFNGATNPTKSPMHDVYARLIKSKKKLKWSDIDELKESKKQLAGVLK